MNEVFALFLVLLLATSGYAAGRMHGQLGYRHGYRMGYRQGYFDGDRSSWNRRRRELQAAVVSVLKTPPAMRAAAYPAGRGLGTTYTSSTYEDSAYEDPAYKDSAYKDSAYEGSNYEDSNYEDQEATEKAGVLPPI